MVSRRQLLGGAGGAALAIAGLSACSSDGGGETTSGSQQGDTQQPTYTPFPGAPEPDLPADPDAGVPPAYFSYPEISDAGPLPRPEIAPFSIMAQATGIPAGDNTWSALLAEQMGAKFELIAAPSAEYTSKFQVMMASNDLPDLLQIATVPQFPQLLEAKMTDLTPYLAGDAINNYPGLASIMPKTWEIPLVNGKYWGVSQSRPPAGRIISTRGDILAERGLEATQSPANGEEFLDILRELSGGGKFAMGADPYGWLLPALLEMMGAPNAWSEEGGKFTHQFESPIYKEALAVAAQVWDEGLLHPESISNPGNNSMWLTGGVTSLYIQAFTGWQTFAQNYPDWGISYLELPQWDGGGPAPIHAGPAGYGAWVGITKQDSEERVLELLGILDYIASPFGSTEYTALSWGVEGTHYNLDESGNPAIVAAARERDQVGGIGYAGSKAYSQLYLPGQKELVEAQHEYLTKKLPDAVANAATGLYSESATSKGAGMSQQIKSEALEIIQGRKPVDSWDAVVTEWKGQSGDASRKEYEDAFAAAQNG
ncbi:extracellular solute-binding protein [Parenemella sanctibonifatiensis]|uniref:Extracellular solute-binding protein n=1 Tax=Parenemella sanctibonifatiensis TaxID=2016505 RepID=A0A255ET69_9ACTN|nr:extracellular solute-binding protein [Parenemella sanctibonifatiensis]OYN92622.1 hypothetical protein CGZ91_03875 [Parenemella sanctibonifatiensis]